ncbi:hypothetical protein [Candidatus Mycoplasma haematohominis]|uniref:Uncharacterized protein n=1 Tax=Candidatus Mycoplasma haematohominis TaxID=1494318 RepID=A0A478FQ48_9MOLU|nr:hypothetical protein [Candidatus Mycoplasma haemohominis]GCE63581.1 hypothetical protein MHSWG343_05780 [Candidatus Mycoplasma haemohominis]
MTSIQLSVVATGTVAVVAAAAGTAAYMTSSSSCLTIEQAEKAGKIVRKDGDSSDYWFSNNLASLGNNASFLVASISENEGWWNSKYDSQLKPLKGGNNRASSKEFQKVTKGYDKDDKAALNKVCDAAYKENIVKFTNNGDSEKKKYADDVQRFCTNEKSASLKFEADS